MTPEQHESYAAATASAFGGGSYLSTKSPSPSSSSSSSSSTAKTTKIGSKKARASVQKETHLKGDFSKSVTQLSNALGFTTPWGSSFSFI